MNVVVVSTFLVEQQTVLPSHSRVYREMATSSIAEYTGLLLKLLPGKAADRSLRKAESLPFLC